MSRQAKFSFSTVTGYFLQDDEAIVAQDFDYVTFPISFFTPPFPMHVLLSDGHTGRH